MLDIHKLTLSASSTHLFHRQLMMTQTMSTLTYKAVLDAVDQLDKQCLNCQSHLPELIKNIDSKFILPKKISNLVRKCQKWREWRKYRGIH